jgi:hypothetical protein
MEAVRLVMEELGKDAKPLKIQDRVKERFGITMSADHVSNCKGKILRGEGGKGKRKGKRKGKKAKATQPALQPSVASAKPKAAGSVTDRVNLDDVLTVKRLVHRVGATQLRTLIEAFEE